jgi:hypothetical protein
VCAAPVGCDRFFRYLCPVVCGLCAMCAPGVPALRGVRYPVASGVVPSAATSLSLSLFALSLAGESRRVATASLHSRLSRHSSVWSRAGRAGAVRFTSEVRSVAWYPERIFTRLLGEIHARSASHMPCGLVRPGHRRHAHAIRESRTRHATPHTHVVLLPKHHLT